MHCYKKTFILCVEMNGGAGATIATIDMGKPTIKDVAREAGVSIATVSRVLNNSPGVRENLVNAVREAIVKIEYCPNSVARSLKMNATSTIAMLVSDISNSFFTAVSRSIEDYICTFGYNLIVCSTDNDPLKEVSYLTLLKEKQIDGLVLNTTSKNDDLVIQLSQELPIVLSNRNVSKSGFKGDFVDSDNISGVYELTTYLISMGHRKIGVVLGPSDTSTSAERYLGYLKAMQEIGLTKDDLVPYIYEADFTANGGYNGIKALYNQDDRPSVVIVMNNEMMLGAMRYLRANAIQVPEEISIASYGDIINMDILYVQPTIVTLNPYVIGRKIAELLVERIHLKNEIWNREFRYAPMLIKGNSVREL